VSAFEYESEQFVEDAYNTDYRSPEDQLLQQTLDLLAPPVERAVDEQELPF
jgi:hypothetical protein